MNEQQETNWEKIEKVAKWIFKKVIYFFKKLFKILKWLFMRCPYKVRLVLVFVAVLAAGSRV